MQLNSTLTQSIISIPQPFKPSNHYFYLFNQCDQRLTIVLPFLLKLRSRGVLATRQFQCDLKTVGPYVIIILHTTCHQKEKVSLLSGFYSQEDQGNLPSLDLYIFFSLNYLKLETVLELLRRLRRKVKGIYIEDEYI